ncbi:MAG TPA: D-amino acid dehydrogenase [Rubrivivax sp.]|nr:D-amino acid dehydrogenase [Rubrivivax sp.]
MRIAVVGAGIVGVTTAYELATAGHQVTVFERRSSVAEEGSFANAGVVAPGYVTPWAAPGMPTRVLGHLLSRYAPVRIRAAALWRHPGWLWQWWRACAASAYQRNRSAMWRLARFSQARLAELGTRLQLDYEQRSGLLVLLRNEADLARSRPGMRLLADLGVRFELVDAERARLVEPGLNPDMPLRAAIHLPHEGVGNCRQFAQLLKAQVATQGASFRFDTAVKCVLPGPHPRIRTDEGESGFDAVVLCAGVDSARLLAPLGLQIPLVPVHGYSITAPLRHVDGQAEPGPNAALMDERYKVAISRIGQRVRVAGSAELGSDGDRMNPAALATLYRVLDDWFPGAVVSSQALQWKGARPMLPDGPPVLGHSGVDGVWLNLGHGSSGWAMSCGSALVLAELVSGRPSPLDLQGLGIERWRAGRS